jgi:hypothetical protein
MPIKKESVDKPLPANLDAERSILGAILMDNSVLPRATSLLHSGHFSLPQNEIVFRTMVRMGESKEPIDLVTLSDTLKANGDLPGIGGYVYISSLIDGTPRVSNVEHYCKIVREKAALRSIIRATQGWQDQAWGSDADTATILNDVSEFLKLSDTGTDDKRLVAVDLQDFLAMELAPIDFIIEPILPVGNSGMVWSLTGAGKTYIMLYMAYCISAGIPDCFVWNVPRARPVVYVDGEMDKETLQDRQRELFKGFRTHSGPASVPDRGMFKIITPDLQPKYPPRINTSEGRRRIEEHLQEGGLLVADNISTLCPGADEKETEDWAPIQEWILYLRRHRIATFLVHHGNASGQKQMGSSKKEHQLSCNLRLRAASDWTPEQGLRVEARLDKLRRRGKNGHWDPRWGQPFEISLAVRDGAAEFSYRPMMKILRERAIQMLLAGMRENDVATETGLSRFVVYRLNKKIKSDGIAAAESED